MAKMKKAHTGAMHASQSSARKSHAVGLGSSEMEASPWGHGEFANMPSSVHMEMYPKAPMATKKNLDDTITNIDEENMRSNSKENRFLSNQH